jgi:hypothetical protein
MKTYSNKSTDPTDPTDPKKKAPRTGSAGKVTRDKNGEIVVIRDENYAGMSNKAVMENRELAKNNGSTNQISSMGSGYKDKVNKLQGASKKQVKASKKFKVKSNASKAAKKASNRARKMF